MEATNNSNALSIIENISVTQVSTILQRISQFQKVIQETLKQGHDYGIVPGTKKPTLLKPGAEKILMLMGLRSEFDVVDSTRDFEVGFFQYQVRCKLYKADMIITEGLGSCNTKESKYKTQDACSLDNTILKMAKKRALIDASLLVASLSEVFTQDLDDIDLNGEQPTGGQNLKHDDESVISGNQAKRIYALSGGNKEICVNILAKYGYKKSDEVKKIDYEKICKEVEEEAKKSKGQEEF